MATREQSIKDYEHFADKAMEEARVKRLDKMPQDELLQKGYCGFCAASLGAEQMMKYGDEPWRYKTCLRCGYDWAEHYYKDKER